MTGRRLRTWLISAGNEDVAVAATSKTAAVAALDRAQRHWSLYAFNQYASDLRDDHRIAVMALARPGVVFARSNRWSDDAWYVVSPEEDVR